jgi:hypothetical protein
MEGNGLDLRRIGNVDQNDLDLEPAYEACIREWADKLGINLSELCGA